MKTITKTIELYRYSELSEDARECVKQWYLDGLDPGMFLDECTDWLKYKYGLFDMNVQFSLGYSQGDGLNIYGAVTFWELEEKIMKDSTFTQKELKRLHFYYKQMYNNIRIPANPRYCYDYSNHIDFATEWIAELEYDRIRNIDEQLIYRFEDYLKQVFRSINAELEQHGYDFFYEISDSDLSDICDANDWYFTANGTYYFDEL